MLNPFKKKKKIDSSELKEFADDIFKYGENVTKFLNHEKTLWEKEKLLVTVDKETADLDQVKSMCRSDKLNIAKMSW